MLPSRQQLRCECERECGCVRERIQRPLDPALPPPHTHCRQFMHVKCISARVCVYICAYPLSNSRCATTSVTESLHLQSCHGEQTLDGQLAKIHTLFPYIFMKGHLFTADRFFRSVSRVIYRPATPEGLYIWGRGGEELLTALQPCQQWTNASSYTHTRHQCSVPHPSRVSVMYGLPPV